MKSKEKLNNVIVLNKLPSNMVKEAIIVLRRDYNFENVKNEKLKENIIREAEDVILNFIKESEKEKEKKEFSKIKKRYKISKYINYCMLIMLTTFFVILNIIK